MSAKIRYSPYRGAMDEAERTRIRDSELYKLGDTVLAWVNEGDLCGLGENMDRLDIDWKALAKALAPLYLRRPAEIAATCDERLDRSGALLGLVRDCVRS